MPARFPGGGGRGGLRAAAAVLVWNGDLPRPLQQMLFETADSLTAPTPTRPAELISLSTA